MALHMLGVQLIAVGVDGGSRERAERLRWPEYTAWARRLLRDLLQEHGWRVTLDLFAADSNAFVELYVSWTEEPGSEAVDASGLRSWNQTLCVCGQFHRETLFVFPQRGLERAVVRRAKSDNVRGCFVVPTNHKASCWKLLRSSAVARMAFDKPDEAFEFAQAPLSTHDMVVKRAGWVQGRSGTALRACVHGVGPTVGATDVVRLSLSKSIGRLSSSTCSKLEIMPLWLDVSRGPTNKGARRWIISNHAVGINSAAFEGSF